MHSSPEGAQEGLAGSSEEGRTVALLGPQHESPCLAAVLPEAGMQGPYVLSAAGWEEREAETGALEEHLGEPVANLGLWPACEAAFGQDPGLKKLMFDRYDRMKDLSRIYRLRLNAELGAIRELYLRTDPRHPDDLVGPALGPAFEALRALDEHHQRRVSDVNDATFEEASGRPVIVDQRGPMAEVVGKAGALLIAGGHVGILYNRMRLYGIMGELKPTAGIVGWSAGAMVLTERLMLFHDSPPKGVGNAEIHGPGFGLATGVVVLPHASTRLKLLDPARVAILTRRVAPHVAIALDAGQYALRGPGESGWTPRAGARTLSLEGDFVGAEQ